MSVVHFAGAAIAAALVLASPADVGAAGQALGLAVSPARLEFKVPAGTTRLESEFQVANRGSQPVTVEVALADVVIDRTGTWQLLPAGSTPYSFPAVFTPSTLQLGVGQVATVRLSAQLTSPRPMLGGALVHPVAAASAAGAGSTGLRVNPDILVPLVAAPVGSSGVVEGVELSGRAAGIQAPQFAEHGPLQVTSEVANSSSFYERSFVTIEWSWLGHVFLRIDEPPVGTFPGGVARTSASTVVQVPGAGAVDVAPWFCVCKVTTTTHLTLLDSTAPPIIQSAWVVVVPWRLLALVVAVLGGVAWGARARRRRP
jgi:hypothetical protein